MAKKSQAETQDDAQTEQPAEQEPQVEFVPAAKLEEKVADPPAPPEPKLSYRVLRDILPSDGKLRRAGTTLFVLPDEDLQYYLDEGSIELTKAAQEVTTMEGNS